jgi:hypothetical protein
MTIKTIFISALTCILITCLITGCSSNHSASQSDETGAKTVVGYVNADPFYLISINNNMRDFCDFLRQKRSIYYQPSPDYLLKLEYVALRDTIDFIGLKQPGNSIDPKELLKRAEQLSVEKGNKIVERMKSGATLEEISAEFSVEMPKGSTKIIRGNNPGYDDAILSANIGEPSGPIVHQDRVLVFKVEDRGTDENNQEWANVILIEFLFDRNGAKRLLIDELKTRWDIKIVDKYYSALDNYFNDHLDVAVDELRGYLAKGDNKDGMGHFLMTSILRDQALKDGTDNTAAIEQNIIQAIAECSNNELRPYLNYQLGVFYTQLGKNDEGDTAFRKSFDEITNNIYLAEILVQTFKQINDDEYFPIAYKKIAELRKLMEAEQARQPKMSAGSDEDASIELPEEK